MPPKPGMSLGSLHKQFSRVRSKFYTEIVHVVWQSCRCFSTFGAFGLPRDRHRADSSSTSTSHAEIARRRWKVCTSQCEGLMFLPDCGTG